MKCFRPSSYVGSISVWWVWSGDRVSKISSWFKRPMTIDGISRVWWRGWALGSVWICAWDRFLRLRHPFMGDPVSRFTALTLHFNFMPQHTQHSLYESLPSGSKRAQMKIEEWQEMSDAKKHCRSSPPLRTTASLRSFLDLTRHQHAIRRRRRLRFLALTYSPGKRRQQLYSSSSLGGNDGVTTSSTTQRTKRISNNWLWIP